jgi:hypothetical protein
MYHPYKLEVYKMEEKLFNNVFALVLEGIQNKHSATHYKRICSLCKKLNATQEQTVKILRAFSYLDKDGIAYPWLAKKLEGK